MGYNFQKNTRKIHGGGGGVGGVVTVLTRALKTNRMSHYKRKPNSKRHAVNGTKISRIMGKLKIYYLV